MSNTLTNEGNQRSLKDFLTLYNTITEYCFTKCISKFNERIASQNETSCVDVCTDNYVQFNQRFMFNFMDHQERRKRDAERAAVEAAAKEQEQQQQQLREAAAAFAAGQEQGSAGIDAAVAAASAASASLPPSASLSPSSVPTELPLKTGQATQLLESLSTEAGSVLPGGQSSLPGFVDGGQSQQQAPSSVGSAGS